MAAATSRTNCTAGNRKLLSTAMIAIRTSSSISVKAARFVAMRPSREKRQLRTNGRSPGRGARASRDDNEGLFRFVWINQRGAADERSHPPRGEWKCERCPAIEQKGKK